MRDHYTSNSFRFCFFFSPPPILHPSLLAVPKKLLQEQALRNPAFSPPPSVHDPNIVGDSPPKGPSVKSHNSASGTHAHALVPQPLASTPQPRAGNNKQPPSQPSPVIHVSSRVMCTCRHVYTHMVQPFPYVYPAEPSEFHAFLITGLF